MQILERYLIKEVLYLLLGVTVVLMLIFVTGELISLYGKVASGNIPLRSVMTMLGLNSLSNLVVVLPLSFYLAMLLAFSRLYKDNEMVVLTACGVGSGWLLRTLWRFGVLVAIIAGIISLYLAPWAEAQVEGIIKQAKEHSDLEGLSAGRFKELTRGEGVVYIQEFNEKTSTMGNVFIQQDEANKSSIISASSGLRVKSDQSDDQFFVMLNGYRYETQLLTNRSAVIRFERHGVRLKDITESARTVLRHRAMTTYDLWQRGQAADIAEIQRRVAVGLSVLILGILALPLSRTSPRQGRYAKLALALLIFMIYTNLLNVSIAWLIKSTIPVWVGVWWVNVLALVLAALLYFNWGKVRYRWRQFRQRKTA